MIVLGIESSCDDSAAAVLRDGRLASSVVSSQDAVHGPFGGVVPELASRHHVRNMLAVVHGALERATVTLDDVDGIAVTRGPGLIGSVLVGLAVAKGIAMQRGLPLVGVHHLEGHLLAANIDRSVDDPVPFPFLALIVSGGHSGLYLARTRGDYACLGKTRDDAVGEAFDKVAKTLGLGYPGGPVIERIARDGNPAAIRFPRARLKRGRFDLSFSGFKTAVWQHVRDQPPTPEQVPDIAASVQEALVDMLVDATAEALDATGVERLVVSGGVSANKRLRERMAELGAARGVEVIVPRPALCTDNAAMIAMAGWPRLAAGADDGLGIEAEAALPLRHALDVVMGARREARDALAAAGLRPQRRFGQHFLCDRGVARRIVDAAGVGPASVVLEIGPGLGALTDTLAERAGRLYLVEIDRALAARLVERHAERAHVTVLEGDVLALPLDVLVAETGVTVVGNLPYNISTPILFRLLGLRARFPRAVLMLQREVAVRIASKPGAKDWGVLSVMVQTWADVRIAFGVSRRSFLPRPAVESSVLVVDWSAAPRVDVGDPETHRAVVRAAFGQRRKMLRNALADEAATRGIDVEAALAAAGIDPRVRAETLGLDDFGRLARAFGPG